MLAPFLPPMLQGSGCPIFSLTPLQVGAFVDCLFPHDFVFQFNEFVSAKGFVSKSAI